MPYFCLKKILKHTIISSVRSDPAKTKMRVWIQDNDLNHPILKLLTNKINK